MTKKITRQENKEIKRLLKHYYKYGSLHHSGNSDSNLEYGVSTVLGAGGATIGTITVLGDVATGGMATASMLIFSGLFYMSGKNKENSHAKYEWTNKQKQDVVSHRKTAIALSVVETQLTDAFNDIALGRGTTATKNKIKKLEKEFNLLTKTVTVLDGTSYKKPQKTAPVKNK